MTNSEGGSLAYGSTAQDTLCALIGSAPLLPGEDRAAFEAFRSKFYQTVRPEDVIEEIWVNDCVDLAWDKLRLHRLKLKFLESAAHEGLNKIIHGLNIGFEHHGLSHAWQRRDAYAVEKVKQLLQQAGLDEEAITAQTFMVRLDELEKLERIIAGKEARFNKCLQEITRHRDVIARRIREASQVITNSAFSELSAQNMAAAE